MVTSALIRELLFSESLFKYHSIDDRARNNMGGKIAKRKIKVEITMKGKFSTLMKLRLGFDME